MGKKHEMSLKWLQLFFDRLPLPKPLPKPLPVVAAEAAVAFMIVNRTMISSRDSRLYWFTYLSVRLLQTTTNVVDWVFEIELETGG